MGGHWPLKFLPDFPLHSVGNGLDRSVALDYHPCERLFSGSETVKTVPYNAFIRFTAAFIPPPNS